MNSWISTRDLRARFEVAVDKVLELGQEEDEEEVEEVVRIRRESQSEYGSDSEEVIYNCHSFINIFLKCPEGRPHISL